MNMLFVGPPVEERVPARRRAHDLLLVGHQDSDRDDVVVRVALQHHDVGQLIPVEVSKGCWDDSTVVSKCLQAQNFYIPDLGV